PVLTFDESGHVDSRDRDTKLYLDHRSGVKEFSHSLGREQTILMGCNRPVADVQPMSATKR
ncbi:hypothetical protein, partial [Achromobacter mucicolens]|uniref:hypothetical protein n=1 Tax=Achromobacter mucicolens TaxID=1389922 RepID=UPI001C2E56FB